MKKGSLGQEFSVLLMARDNDQNRKCDIFEQNPVISILYKVVAHTLINMMRRRKVEKTRKTCFPNFCCIYLIGKKIYPTLQIFHQILTKNCF